MEILRRLSHPNILKCYELLEDEAKYYIVTEYCEGGSLKDRLTNHKKLTEKEAAEVMLQVLSAVSYMHATKIVHRDIRPENILLLGSGSEFEVKIADFSQAAVCGR
jgi:serine/threonine protein kinase